uniref:Uncharacterized protein n=1 Tax=Anguilla anguilla TaxID=7936 RepID=A0A0E9TW08_ANGAN
MNILHSGMTAEMAAHPICQVTSWQSIPHLSYSLNVVLYGLDFIRH